jgi:hypothetical protein
MVDQKIFKYGSGSYWRPKASSQMLIWQTFFHGSAPLKYKQAVFYYFYILLLFFEERFTAIRQHTGYNYHSLAKQTAKIAWQNQK